MPQSLTLLVSALVQLAYGFAAQVSDKKDFILRETTKAGESFEVSATVSLQGKIADPKSKGDRTTTAVISASGATRYRERILDAPKGRGVTATSRRYQVATLEKKPGQTNQRIVLRPSVERVVISRADDQSTIFSPDGPLTAPELDLLRADSFTPALVGLLPSNPVKTGDHWPATTSAAMELTGVAPIQLGAIECTLRDVTSSDEGELIRVSLAGSLTGPSEQGPCRQTIDGHFMFDLDHQLTTYILLNGRSEILDSDGNVVGQLEGRFELHRRLAIDDPRLTDAALAGLKLKPTAETTALLFEERDLGIRILYPRNWELGSVKKNVVQLDELTGGRLLLTVDPSPPATADKLRSELIAWLQMQKATVREAGTVQSMSLSNSRKAERFTVRAGFGHQGKDKGKEWTYILIRQGDRSAIVAANLLEERTQFLREDIESVARSVEFMSKSRQK